MYRLVFALPFNERNHPCSCREFLQSLDRFREDVTKICSKYPIHIPITSFLPKPLGFAKSRPRQERLPPMPSPHPNPNTPLPVLTQQPSHAPPGPIILPQVEPYSPFTT